MAKGKERSKVKKLLKEREQENRSNVIETGIQQMYDASIADVKRKVGLNMDDTLELQHVSSFLNRLVAEYYLNGIEPVGQRSSKYHVTIPFHIILNCHDNLLENPQKYSAALALSAFEMQNQMDKWFAYMAKYMYNNYIKLTNEGVKRSTEETLRIVNEPNTRFYSSWLLRSYSHCRTVKEWNEFTEVLSLYFYNLTAVYTDKAEEVIRQVVSQGEEERKKREGGGKNSSTASTSECAPPERKSLQEYERLVQLSKEREAREAEERLAVQRENDARIAAQREEATRAEERANQERQDAILRRLERVNFEEIEPLDAVAAAKAAETEREAREAKEKALNATR